jgi:hypothetical protein
MKVDGPHMPGDGSQVMYLKKRMAMRPGGILMQPNATYIPKLVGLMKVSGRRKKGLPYHATLEAFSADLIVESELLDHEQAANFRSGLGLALYLAMDRPNIQFAVKTLASYMARPTVKASSVLKHLASYLDGTHEHGLLLQNTDEDRCIFDVWREDEVICDEINVPQEKPEARFNLEAFSDSSWADCKSTRRSTSSGLVFLNGSMILSICRTQASVALSSLEAELYAANGLMVECMYLYRLCKFLCKDEEETNNSMVQQRLYTDSASAFALVQRAGTGRLKHVQIKQFYLQNLLRSGIFTIHKVNTKLNPSDLNTKRLSQERRKFVSRLIGLFMADSCEENDDSELRRVKKVNQVTKQQCVRFIQVATATLNACLQLKGCSSELSLDAGGQDFELYDGGGATTAMVMEAILEKTYEVTHMVMMVVGTSFHAGFYIVGVLVTLALVIFMVMGPVTWRNSRMTRWFEIQHAARTMGWRHRLLTKPSLQVAHYLLGCEIAYLHERFRRAGQRGDMMVDIESIHADLDEYLGGQRIRADEPREAVPPEPEGGEEERPPADDPADGDEHGDEIVRMALNGRRIDTAPTESELDDRHGIAEGGESDVE